MDAPSKSWHKASPFGTAHNLRLTQPLLAPLAGMARHTPMLPPPPQPPSPRLRGANASRSTLSLHPNAAAVLSLWGWKSAGAGRGQGARHPAGLQAAAVGAYTRRWAALLSCTAQRAFSASLLELPLGATDHTDGDPPPFFDLLAEARGDDPPHPSRLPLRQGIWPCDQWRWKRRRRKKKPKRHPKETPNETLKKS